MLKKFSRLLLIANLTVFVLVLGIFSIFVFLHSSRSIETHERQTLDTLADSVISSIDFDDHGKEDAGQPDLISSALPDESAKALLGLRLQWFDRRGILMSQKGNLEVSLPFSIKPGFQTQSHPHALLLTKAAYANGQLLGYVRIAEPLANADTELQRLATSLVLGMVAALAASAVGILVLLRISLQPVMTAMHRLRQFTADASHDFRSPLMAIKSNSSVALRYPEGMRPGDRDRFMMICEATDRMIKLAEDLLDLAQAEGEPRITLTTIDLSEVLTHLLASYKSFADSKNIRIDADIPESIMVVGEPIGLQRLFSNLLQNALQYTPTNGNVRVTAKESLKTVVVTVEDDGIGIEQPDQLQIFERFWRADKSRSSETKGSGLGLSIAQAIAKQHGGTITVSSAKGKGSCFRVSIKSSR